MKEWRMLKHNILSLDEGKTFVTLSHKKSTDKSQKPQSAARWNPSLILVTKQEGHQK